MKLAVVLTLWIVAIWRLPAARQEPWKRALWVAFAALGAALTFSLPQVSSGIEELTGVTALATLLKHVTGIAACAAVLEWVIALTRQAEAPSQSRRRITAAALAAVTMAILFGFVDRESGDFTDIMAGDPTATAYLLVFETYLGLAMGLATALFFVAARRAPRGLLRAGLWILTAGAALGVGYAALRGVYLIRCLGDGHGHAESLYNATEHLQLAAIVLILLGSTLPAITVALEARRAYQDLNTLYPLWRRLTTSTPGVVLGAPPRRRNDLTTFSDLHLRLLRRTVEIRDARLLLRGYVCEEDRNWAHAQLQARGLTGERLDAATEAVWLRAAVDARAAGWRPQAAAPRQSLGGSDLAGEVRWLRLIAAADRSKDVAAVTSALRQHLTVELS